jgi:hypothetical protein
VYGSASPPANPIRVATNGNVGFGNTNPNSGIAVRIRRDSVVAQESDVAFRIDTSEAAGGVGMGFGTNAAAGYGYIQSVEPGTSYSSKGIVFQPNGGTVGVGLTAIASAKLHVATTGDADGVRMDFRASPNGSNGTAVSFYHWNNNSTDISITRIKSVMTSGTVGLEGGDLSFQTKLSTGALAEKARLYSDGAFLLSSVGGLGYGTGSGGTVTQATSKSTSVTLNKTNGQIVMNNAALAAGATVSFTFLNSTIATTDVVVISCASGSAASAYRAGISQTTSGAATVTVTNFSGGSLSEALVLNFAVIKAVTA